jgi:hypothetical protein
MTNEQILTKAIDKAVRNGYVGDELNSSERGTVIANYSKAIGKQAIFKWWSYALIFSHDFTKAFWGNEDYCFVCAEPDSVCECREQMYCKEWEMRLCEMVLKEDPIKYLEAFLDEK